MNDLEWINLQIEMLKRESTVPGRYTYTTKEINHYKQIKSELNVLKIITKCIRVTPVSYDEDGLSKTAYDYCLETDVLTDKEYQILDEYMKTLEEEENVD